MAFHLFYWNGTKFSRGYGINGAYGRFPVSEKVGIITKFPWNKKDKPGQFLTDSTGNLYHCTNIEKY
jgi:hypothetical protein